MPKHADDEPVTFHYGATSNISFKGAVKTDIVWADWRRMTNAEKQEAYAEVLNGLVDIWEDEDE